MKEQLLAVLCESFLAVMAVLVPLLTAMLTSWINEKLRSERAAAATVELSQVISDVVGELAGTADDLKDAAADGKLTEEERIALKKGAVKNIKRYLGTTGLKRIAKALGLNGELDELLETKVEAEVRRTNGGKKLTGELLESIRPPG